MKKIVSMFLAIIMMLSLAACGGDQKSTTSDDSAANDASVSSSATSENEDSENGEANQISFEELTVVDNDQCTIKITDIDPDNPEGYTLNTYMENKSSDKTYTYSITSASVNGVQTVIGFAKEIAAGGNANEEFSIPSDFSAYGIDQFTDIEISFVVYDTDDWTADSVAEETIHVYPYGEDKATTFVRESQAADTVLVDNEDVSVIVTDYDENGTKGYTMNLYLVNKTDKELIYTIEDTSVNGDTIDSFWAETVGAGKVMFSSISWYDSDFEDNGITAVEEIEMRLNIYDSEDSLSDAVYDEVITLNP